MGNTTTKPTATETITRSIERVNLHDPAQNGDLETVKNLVGQGANINEYSTRRFMPLHLAAGSGHKDVVEFLLDKGAMIDVPDRMLAFTSLHWASKSGHKDVVELLLNRGAMIDNPINVGGSTPLHLAAEGGHMDVVQLLIKKRAAINKKDKNSETAIGLATKNNQLAIVRVLQKEACMPRSEAVKRALEYIRKNGNVCPVQGINITPKDSNTSSSINSHSTSPQSSVQLQNVSEHNKQSYLNKRR